MASTTEFWRIEIGSSSHKNRTWRWIASCHQRHDAEQLLMRHTDWLDKPRRTISSDLQIKITMPHGPYDKGEF